MLSYLGEYILGVQKRKYRGCLCGRLFFDHSLAPNLFSGNAAKAMTKKQFLVQKVKQVHKPQTKLKKDQNGLFLCGRESIHEKNLDQ